MNGISGKTLGLDISDSDLPRLTVSINRNKFCPIRNYVQ